MSIRYVQITDTVDYTEVMFRYDMDDCGDNVTDIDYDVVRHDTVVATYINREEAMKHYNKIIRRPGRGDYR